MQILCLGISTFRAAGSAGALRRADHELSRSSGATRPRRRSERGGDRLHVQSCRVSTSPEEPLEGFAASRISSAPRGADGRRVTLCAPADRAEHPAPFRVVSGLESMISARRDSWQVKKAYAAPRKPGRRRGTLNKLFQRGLQSSQGVAPRRTSPAVCLRRSVARRSCERILASSRSAT
jgi:hypothetical protein